jgi:hypothetical protein
MTGSKLALWRSGSIDITNPDGVEELTACLRAIADDLKPGRAPASRMRGARKDILRLAEKLLEPWRPSGCFRAPIGHTSTLMSKADDRGWAVARTMSGRDYDAQLELSRLGLTVYFPQARKLCLLRGLSKPVMRKVPLFPGYVFLPIAEAKLPQVQLVVSLARPKPLLCDCDGRVKMVGGDDIFVLSQMENEGAFDDRLPLAGVAGDRVRAKGSALPGVDLLLTRLSARTVELLTPLFGGCRGTARVEGLTGQNSSAA